MKLPTIAPRVIMIIAAVVLFAFLAWFGPSQCQKLRSQRAQSGVDGAQADAFQNSAGDAVAAQAEANARESTSEATTRSNERNIRDAQGSSDAVNPAVRDAGFASLCKRPAFRDSPTGRLRCTAAAGVEKGR